MKLKQVRVITFVFICAAHFTNAQAPTFQWAKVFGGTSNEVGWSTSVDAVGNVHTVGTFSGTVDFDSGPGVSNLTASGDDIFVSKLDGSGNFIWARRIGGGGVDQGFSVISDANGDIYTTGHFSGVVDFDPGIATYTLGSAVGGIFILKLDAAGNFVWAKTISASVGMGNDLGIDGSGNLLTQSKKL